MPQPVTNCEVDETASPSVDSAALPITPAFFNQRIEGRFLQALLSRYKVTRIDEPACVTNARLDQDPSALEAHPKRCRPVRMVCIYRDKECWTKQGVATMGLRRAARWRWS